jgi:hypothetical protein
MYRGTEYLQGARSEIFSPDFQRIANIVENKETHVSVIFEIVNRVARNRF